MKVRDTSPGRLYALSSEIGCTAINGAMAVDIPAGGQVVVLALAKKIVIDGDDAAKFVEVRWGANTVVGSRPAPAWLSDVLSGLISIAGDDNFDINYIPAENKLYLQFSLGVTTEQIEEVKTLLARVLPKDLAVEMEWADGLPMSYTRLEYLESTGTQYINSEVNPGTYVNVDITIERTQRRDSYDVFFGKNQDPEVGVSRMNIAAAGNVLQTEFGWWPNTGFNITDSQKMHITFESEIGDFEGSKATVNDEEIIAALQLTYFRGDVSGLTDPLYFFARNTNGRPTANSCCRIYSCSIKTKTAMASFIPALDKLGNPGFYCPETKIFLTNLGSGDFAYSGNELEVSTFSLRRSITYAQLTKHGIRRLYHVPKGYIGTMDEYAATNGFKELIEPPMPFEGYWAPEWRETDTQLILDWVETEPPTEEDTENA